MKQIFTANVWQEDATYVAQAIEVGVISQGESVEDALANLKEALELYYASPTATVPPWVYQVEVDIAAVEAAPL